MKYSCNNTFLSIVIDLLHSMFKCNNKLQIFIKVVGLLMKIKNESGPRFDPWGTPEEAKQKLVLYVSYSKH